MAAKDNEITSIKDIDIREDINILSCEKEYSRRRFKMYIVKIDGVRLEEKDTLFQQAEREIQKKFKTKIEICEIIQDCKTNESTLHVKVPKEKKDKEKIELIRFVKEGETVEDGKKTQRTFSHLQPDLRTSKGTVTEGEEIGETDKIIEASPIQGCAIGLDYERINRMHLVSYLTKPETYDRVRLVLAYLRHHRNDHYEGHTYISTCIKLRAQGFPKDDEKLEEIYFTYCRNQGFEDDEIDQDLKTYGRFLAAKRTMQVNAAAKAHKTYETGATYSSYRPSQTTKCDPDCTIL